MVGLLLALVVAACGGTTQDLTRCGNGRIDAGEQCDDGNTVDTDACTAVCQRARCGDGAVEQGVELCDGGNIGLSVTCDSLGFSNGSSRQPNCNETCTGYDLSMCGPAYTPTPVVPTVTVTATRTNSPTASPTATLKPESCGDGLLEPGETCSACPADCEPAACAPSGTTSTFSIAISGSRQASDVAVQLAYRSAVIGIPGSGNDVSVRQRVRFAPPVPSSFTVADLDFAVDIGSLRAAGLPSAPSPFATARFDDCSGAPAPTVEDLSCVVERCSDAAGAIAGCACVVTPER
jgi:cysteine-rich repeat protein